MTLSTGTNRFKMTVTPKFALPLCHRSLFTFFYDALLQEIFLRSADGIVFVQSFVTDEWVTTAPTKPRGLPPPSASQHKTQVLFVRHKSPAPTLNPRKTLER